MSNLPFCIIFASTGTVHSYTSNFFSAVFCARETVTDYDAETFLRFRKFNGISIGCRFLVASTIHSFLLLMFIDIWFPSNHLSRAAVPSGVLVDFHNCLIVIGIAIALGLGYCFR